VVVASGIATRTKMADENRMIVELSVGEDHGENSLKGVG
jgi:hypothetical protein